MDDKENNNSETSRDPWAEEFFGNVVNGTEEKPKNPGIYGRFDAEKGEEIKEDTGNGEASETENPEAENTVPEDEGEEFPEEEAGFERSVKGDRTVVAVFVIGIVLLILLGGLCGFFIGRIVSKTGSSNGKSSLEGGGFTEKGASSEQLMKLEEIFKFISDNYYLETNADELLEGAVIGMVDSINDPYGRYKRPGKMEDYKDFINGKYTGIGTAVEKTEGGFKVTGVEKGSPADTAGIKVSDIIVTIDGSDISSATESEIEGILSKENATLSIGVKSEDGGMKTVSVSTEKLTRRIVEGRDLGDGIVYIRIDQFTPSAPSEFAAMLESLRTEDTKALVLDLRDNPGGYVEDAAEIADMLLPEGVIATAKERDGTTVETYTSDEKNLGLKLCVLVNKNTASAAELVTGAVADFKAGTVIGEKTYGKAVGQIMISFPHDGSGLTLSAFRYYTPSGKCIDGIGIEPDVKVQPGEGYENKKASEIPFEDDLQLQEALKVLAG